MTILTDVPRQHDYLGNGATTAYAYTFLVFAASDLQVSQDDVLLVLNTHYTVSGVGEGTGGTVTMVIPVPDLSTLKIRSDVPITQATRFPEGYRFPGRTVEANFDRLTVIARELKDAAPAFELPTPALGKVLGWNAALTGLENVDPGIQGAQGLQGIQGPPGAGSAPIVRETDGSPSIAVPTAIEFTGATVTEPSAGVARVTIPTPSAVPAGVVMPYAGAAAPTGYLLCDGAAVSRATFADLFAAIGVAFGAGDTTTTFNVPDLRGRFPLGAGVGPGLTARSLAATGGEEAHALLTAELPSHSHGITDPTHNHGGSGGISHAHSIPVIVGDDPVTGSGFVSSSGTAALGATGAATATVTIGAGSTGVTVNAAGGNGTHNTVPPFAVLAYIVKT